jgi:hypothetical protein
LNRYPSSFCAKQKEMTAPWLLLVLFLIISSPAAAVKYVVNSTADTGAGSLRWAIDQANARLGYDEVGCFVGRHSLSPKQTTSQQLTIRLSRLHLPRPPC